MAGCLHGRAGGRDRRRGGSSACCAAKTCGKGIEWRYDVSRINELRRRIGSTALFQPMIQLLARVNRKLFRDSLAGDLPRDSGGRPAAVLAARGVFGKLQLIALALVAGVRLLVLRCGSGRRRTGAGGVWRCC